jgi:hypothetical protein
MALKIKDGIEIWAYGPASNPFTSESNLSQEQLEHLQKRFPDQIEEVETEKKISKSKTK